jgi:hypothetical protein
MMDGYQKYIKMRLPGIEPGPPAWGGNHATRQQTLDEFKTFFKEKRSTKTKKKKKILKKKKERSLKKKKRRGPSEI